MSDVVKITKTHGNCSCGELVTRVENDPLSTRYDLVRYTYPGAHEQTGWNIFRCKSCNGVIDETWQAAAQQTQGGE